MDNKSKLMDSISWVSGILFSAIAMVNIFWGNDPVFGIFLLALSLVYYPPLNALLKKWTGYVVPGLVKIALGLFILWASLGVGELLNKIGLMLQSF